MYMLKVKRRAWQCFGVGGSGSADSSLEASQTAEDVQTMARKSPYAIQIFSDVFGV